eukprot:CAMPEP_0116113456 /NCGR_PEP_ID=MMETSP0327-20121206/19518_1 /TAXON_ID=44447 /ORGANISM="Pseudo-nitzschia delicatissima, Strain B596" /LENGTH=576 /DNA_ID=CAMNT_0003606815 /DNA_START=34 /DNA_END=1761 /DNA_ORIENTATION=+
MEQNSTSLETIFQSCSFAASNRATESSNSSNDSVDITSFFVDSSGRSSFTLPLQMTFDSKKDLDKLLAANCFDPPPRSLVSEADQRDEPATAGDNIDAAISFEVKSIQSENDESNHVTVEGVSILSCCVKNLVATFQTKVTVRATTDGALVRSVSSADSLIESPSRFSSSPQKSNRVKNANDTKSEQPLHQVNHSASFKITPVLTIEKSDKTKNHVDKDSFSPDLTLLGLAAIPDQMQYNKSSKASSSILSTSNDRFHETRLSPVTINVTLTNAFSITVQSIPGPKSRLGNTLVSLSIKHSKTHNLPVTITNIAVHPGHSRHDVIVTRNNKNSSPSRGPPRIQQAVSNMTECVEWGYAPKTELKLPLTLRPYEAYSSIISISSGEERSSRQFLSPLSVTGVIGMNAEQDSSEKKDDDDDDDCECRVVVASDVCWTTKPIAVEPADAFRIDMCTVEPTVQRGEPMVVKLRIFNLSLESRNLMIFMAKKDQGPSTHDKSVAAKEESVNAAVVTESKGYTFGVWGISSEDDGTVRLNRDHELLAIDTALVLGEVQGQHAVDAELRFVPLRRGRLKVPNW